MAHDQVRPNETRPTCTRRRFLYQVAASGAAAAMVASEAAGMLDDLTALTVQNPLSQYPNRGWEKVYRDLYRSDSTFTLLCAPNDTHNCLLRAHVKNGVVTRLMPTYGFGKATDLAGNRASGRWDPRCCQKGLALVRRFYGDRRCKRPMVRAGFRQWIADGMPRDPKTGEVDRTKYLRRGQDGWEAISWEQAFEMSAKALANIAETYTGAQGQERLSLQGYDPLMVEATQGAGTQVLKFRGGMPALGATRVFALYRLANSLALLDAKLRGVGPEQALGARNWDSYTWHTDLPPGHPMVTGQQTLEFDLCNVEHAKVVLVWGMNWIATKMPDSHWLTEARMKGTKVVVIACEYSATMNKADEAVIVRPGTTPALALGMAHVIISEKLYDDGYVKSNTDLPLLVRMDTARLLRASEVFPDYTLAELKNNTVLRKVGEKGPPLVQQPGAVIDEGKRVEWGDHVMWDASKGAPVAVNRDQVGRHFAGTGVDPLLDGEVDVALADGSRVTCRTVFRVTREMIEADYSPEQVEALTWAPAEAIRSLAKLAASNPEKTLFALGMGPNQFFNNDLKDRAVILVAALTRNVGFQGGTVGSYAGNYRTAFMSGVGQYVGEDPFDVESDPSKPVHTRSCYRAESAHYFNAGDRILRMGAHALTGKTHLPTPTKSIMVSNSNSLMGTAKGHYENVVNGYPRVEFIGVCEWWWTASCEYADIVFPADSWAEFKCPDMSISVTNPFLYVFPTTPLPRIHDSLGDIEIAAGIGKSLGQMTDDRRFADLWRFVDEGRARPYLQRIIDASNATRGHHIEAIERLAEQGIPTIIETRTYPKHVGWEQAYEDKPWYTKSGRLEFYREEQEFIDSGENMVVHREPVDATFYEPNVIVASPHPLLRPKRPEDYGVPSSQLDGDTRQARHVVRTAEEVLATRHPLHRDGFSLVFHTPKYRHGTHSTPVDIDIISLWFGPFGDMHREDKRKPFVSEMYVDINPADAKSLGVEDGDYVWIDADPADRPFRGWQKNPEWAKVARLLARARYYPGTPRGVTRMWHNAYAATWGSVKGAATNPTGIAKNPDTNYQAMFRTGSQQSCTRAWLKPTWMTDSLTVKGLFGQVMTQGFVPDVHCPTGAPRESLVKITRAEAGGIGGEGLWRPAALGLRPTYESAELKKYFEGGYIAKG
ncbi:MAG: molybdopterin-dependent oxidoreductase [Phycisphaerales bacterium]|nr:molybdopterin-dependent oxidoreductase [Phycisphaerales bacterium]